MHARARSRGARQSGLSSQLSKNLPPPLTPPSPRYTTAPRARRSPGPRRWTSPSGPGRCAGVCWPRSRTWSAGRACRRSTAGSVKKRCFYFTAVFLCFHHSKAGAFLPPGRCGGPRLRCLLGAVLLLLRERQGPVAAGRRHAAAAGPPAGRLVRRGRGGDGAHHKPDLAGQDASAGALLRAPASRCRPWVFCVSWHADTCSG